MKWQTRSDRPYREAGINPDAIPGEERLGWYQDKDGEWRAAMHSLNGTHAYNPSLDLVPASETVERWIVTWQNHDGTFETETRKSSVGANSLADLKRSQFTAPGCWPARWVGDPIRVEWALPAEEPTP